MRSEIHKHVNSVWNKEELLQQRKETITVPIYKKSDKIHCCNFRGIQNFIKYSCLKVNSISK